MPRMTRGRTVSRGAGGGLRAGRVDCQKVGAQLRRSAFAGQSFLHSTVFEVTGRGSADGVGLGENVIAVEAAGQIAQTVLLRGTDAWQCKQHLCCEQRHEPCS